MTLTDTAEKKIKELCSNNNKWAVRLGIKGGGCAGFSYDWGFADQGEMQDNDELIETEGGNILHAMKSTDNDFIVTSANLVVCEYSE